jgi:hypothetical protein
MSLSVNAAAAATYTPALAPQPASTEPVTTTTDGRGAGIAGDANQVNAAKQTTFTTNGMTFDMGGQPGPAVTFPSRRAAMEAWQALPDSQRYVVEASAEKPGSYDLKPRDASHFNPAVSDQYADNTIDLIMDGVKAIERTQREITELQAQPAADPERLPKLQTKIANIERNTIQPELASLEPAAPFDLATAKLTINSGSSMHLKSLQGGYEGSFALALEGGRTFNISMNMGQTKEGNADLSAISDWHFTVVSDPQSESPLYQPAQLQPQELTQLASLLETKVDLCRNDPQGPINTDAVRFAEGLARTLRDHLSGMQKP